MEARFAAELTDGNSAAIRPTTLAVDLLGVHVRDRASEALVAVWPLAGLLVEDLHNGVLHLQHPSAPGAMLSSRDAGLPGALGRAGVTAAGLPRGRRLLRQAAIYAGALAIVVASTYAAIPWLSRVLARRVPIEIEERLGLQAQGLFEHDLCRSDQARAALAELTERLGRADLEGPAARGVEVINWQMVNAFTFPGGKVLLTRGLVDKAAGPDEIAGVLGHEFEHVRQRHIMAHMIRSSILSVGWALTIGDFSGLFVVDPSTLFSVANQSLSRSDERSADQGALVRLDAARISRQGFAAFFARLADETDAVPAWLTNHPATKERLAAIQVGAPEGGVTPALTEAEWQALKGVCGGREPVRDPLQSLFRRKK